MDGLHSPTPHLHPSNSPSLSSICATCQGHIPTGQKGKKPELSPSFRALLPFFLCRNFSPYQPSSAAPAWNRFLAARALASFMLHLLTRTEDQGPWNTARMLSPQPFLEQAHKSTAHFSPDLSEMHQPPPATSTWTGMLLFRVTFFRHQIWPCLVASCCWVKCIFFWHTDAFVWLALLFLRDHPQPMQLSPWVLFLLGVPESVAVSD